MSSGTGGRILKSYILHMLEIIFSKKELQYKI